MAHFLPRNPSEPAPPTEIKKNCKALAHFSQFHFLFAFFFLLLSLQKTTLHRSKYKYIIKMGTYIKKKNPA